MNETFRYPIKVLLDEDRNIFIPFITSNAVLVSGTNENVAQQLANRYTKAEVDALIQGLGTLQRIIGRVDTYEELPVPIRKGYSFDGWYYDKDLTKKIDFTNTIDFSPIPEYDKHKCHVGYKDIEIYAKWNK